MPTLTVTEDQLHLIQEALDMYSRIGIGQLWVIKDHPTYTNVLRTKLRPKKELKVGDRSERGTVVEIGEGFIKTKGTWGNGEEVKTWTDTEKVKHSIDYEAYHRIRNSADMLFAQGRDFLIQDSTLSNHGSYSIYNESEVDESCRVAYDIVQVIRHEFWKNDPDRSEHVVMSSKHLSTKDSNKIKVEL